MAYNDEYKYGVRNRLILGYNNSVTIKSFFQNIGKTFLGNSISGTGLWGWMIPGDWSKKALLTQYSRYVYSVISAIAMDSAKVDFEVNKMNSEGDILPVKNHPFLALLRKPNADQSQFQFLEMHFTFMKLMGESFWYTPITKETRKMSEIYLLRPDMVDVVIDKSDPRGLVTGYALNKPDGTKTPFEKDEIIHFKMPNPSNQYRGLGPVEAAKTYIETEQYASEFTKNSLYNSGRPSGILNIKGTIDKVEFEKLKRQFKEQYSGTTNAGKTMLLKGTDGFAYQKLGMELGEIALKELKDMSRDDIMIMFRVSKTILGITDDVNRANAVEARAVFTQNIIKPEVDRFIDHVNMAIMPRFSLSKEENGAYLDYQDPTLISESDRQAEWTAGWNKWLTTNDIREERGLDPVEGGDILYIPLNLVPIDQAMLPPEPTPEPAPNPKDPNADPNKSLRKRDLKKKSLSRRERGEVFRQLLFRNQARWEARFKAEIKKEFLRQKFEILKQNKAFDNEQTKSLDTWLFNLLASNERIIKLLYPLAVALLQDQAKWALEMAGDDQTEFMVDTHVQNYITERLKKLADSTNDYTILKIRDSIADGIAAGESVDKLRDRITDIYANATSMRALRIARTETIASSNAAANEAYKQSPLVTYKEWAANPDACEFCASFEGKVVGLEEDFAVQGETVHGQEEGSLPIDYGNVEFPPLHPNCRCTILPVAGE